MSRLEAQIQVCSRVADIEMIPLGNQNIIGLNPCFRLRSDGVEAVRLQNQPPFAQFGYFPGLRRAQDFENGQVELLSQIGFLECFVDQGRSAPDTQTVEIIGQTIDGDQFFRRLDAVQLGL